MKEISKKLNNKKGASILLALMLFFVSFMVASVILSSATANADKIREREELQKEYLSVSSAANLLRDVIGRVEYSGWEQKMVYACQAEKGVLRPEKHQDKVEICEALSYEEGLAEIIRSDLQAMLYEAFLSHRTYVVGKSEIDKVFPKTIVKEFEILGDGTTPVKVKMSLDSDTYMLTCFLTLESDANGVTVVFNGESSASETLENQEDVHEILETDEDGNESWNLRTYNLAIYTTTTVIAYDAGTIKKGVYP